MYIICLSAAAGSKGLTVVSSFVIVGFATKTFSNLSIIFSLSFYCNLLPTAPFINLRRERLSDFH